MGRKRYIINSDIMNFQIDREAILAKLQGYPTYEDLLSEWLKLYHSFSGGPMPISQAAVLFYSKADRLIVRTIEELNIRKSGLSIILRCMLPQEKYAKSDDFIKTIKEFSED